MLSLLILNKCSLHVSLLYISLCFLLSNSYRVELSNKNFVKCEKRKVQLDCLKNGELIHKEVALFQSTEIKTTSWYLNYPFLQQLNQSCSLLKTGFLFVPEREPFLVLTYLLLQQSGGGREPMAALSLQYGSEAAVLGRSYLSYSGGGGRLS